jgi:hypothetical protein
LLTVIHLASAFEYHDTVERYLIVGWSDGSVVTQYQNKTGRISQGEHRVGFASKGGDDLSKRIMAVIATLLIRKLIKNTSAIGVAVS